MQINKEMQYKALREQFEQFVYNSYQVTDCGSYIAIDYRFTIEGLAEFNPHWEISKLSAGATDINDAKLDTLAFSLGMVELVSYWKITCSPNVRVLCGSLSPSQISWWKKLYLKGLGEFFYTNGITPDDDFMTIQSAGNTNCADNISLTQDEEKVLIPIGGGKDSAVTVELLKDYADRYCYIINPRGATIETVKAAKIPDSHVITAKRVLDKNMLELNKQGYLNGHTPFSAIVAFSSVIASYINGIKYVALSNESSANESTVIGSDVNHQYSKSVEFENDFIEYESQHIASGVKYFSLLRPLTEIGIARIFSEFDKYYYIFKSCNVGSKADIWCANCPKCLFVYIILSPFIKRETMIKIFGKEMLDDEALIPTFDKLIGITPEKPFECVGSCSEVRASVQTLLERYEKDGTNPPALIKHYKELGITADESIESLCLSYDESNNLPEKFVEAVKSKLR